MIAIVAALAALSFTVITKMLAKSRTVASVNNLKQLYVAAEGFAGDHRDVFPATYWGDNSANPPIPRAYWWTALAPYLYSDFEANSSGNGKIDGTFRDKADPRVRTIDDGDFRGGKWKEVSYVPWANGTASSNTPIRGISVTRTEDAAGQPYLTTASKGGTWAVANEGQYNSYVSGSAAWRNNQIIVLYCSGAVTIIKDPTYEKVAPAMADDD